MDFFEGTYIDDFIVAQREKLRIDRTLRYQDRLDDQCASAEGSYSQSNGLAHVEHKPQRSSEESKDKQHVDFSPFSPEQKLKTMVRFGEYSPLNPNFSTPGKFVMELGEYEEKRRLLINQKKLEYKEYLSQARLARHVKNYSSSPTSPQISLQSIEEHGNRPIYIRSRDNVEEADKPVSTSENSASPSGHTPVVLENQSKTPHDDHKMLHDNLSPRGRKLADLQASEPLRNNYFDGESARTPSPSIPPHVKEESQHEIYKRELLKQIEEKRKLEMEIKEVERKSEEAIMRRVEAQQEKIRQEYLAEEAKKKEKQKQKSENQEKFRLEKEQLEDANSGLASDNSNLPENSKPNSLEEQFSTNEINSLASNVAFDVPNSPLRERLPQVAVESRSLSKDSGQMQQNFLEPSSMAGFKTPSFTVLDPPNFPNSLDLPSPQSPALSNRSCKTCNWEKQANMHRPIDSFDDSLPIPVLRSISPGSIRRSPTRQTCRSTDKAPNSQAMQVLEAKWKVPAVEKNNLKSYPAGSRPKNVLTQLGAFRRQLQQEQLEMENKLQTTIKPKKRSFRN